MSASEIMKRIEDDRSRLRREVLVRRVLDSLRQTVRLYGLSPDAQVEDVRPEFTTDSAEIIAQLVEAVDILEAIIFASDGCVGHRHCAHSMEPWQRARALLEGKWKADDPGERRTWPEPLSKRLSPHE